MAMRRQYVVHTVEDQAFLSGLQKAADWLTARKVLPDSITVRDHLAKLA
jgi:sulfonate transport system substrate-binding protein